MAATMRSMLRAVLLFLTSSEAKFLPAWQYSQRTPRLKQKPRMVEIRSLRGVSLGSTCRLVNLSGTWAWAAAAKKRKTKTQRMKNTIGERNGMEKQEVTTG